MSAASDKFELDVAKNVNKIPGIKASRPSVSTKYADVLMEHQQFGRTWLEVKMSHTDNLGNPRVFYENGTWQTTYDTPIAKYAVNFLNKDTKTKRFIADISKFTGIPKRNIKIPTTIGGLKKEGAVPLDIMKQYFDRPGVNRYILDIPNMDLGKIVTEHYLKGKEESALYLQAGDDFYKIGNGDPYKVGRQIPLLKGSGNFKMRVSTRSKFYEVQAEIKITSMPDSKFSLKPKTKKNNPFLNR